MYSVILFSVFFALVTVQANVEIEQGNDKDEPVAFETYGSPVYGSPKSAGNVKTTALPASYASYLTSLGYPLSSAYTRYGLSPYNSPYFGYGTPSGYGYGLGGAPLSGYGYPGYGYPAAAGRMAMGYNAYGYGGLPGLGYGLGGLGYSPAALRAAALQTSLNGLASVPVAAANVQVPGSPLPLPVTNVPAYRGPVVPTQGKDGTLVYGYAPAARQRVPLY